MQHLTNMRHCDYVVVTNLLFTPSTVFSRRYAGTTCSAGTQIPAPVYKEHTHRAGLNW